VFSSCPGVATNEWYRPCAASSELLFLSITGDMSGLFNICRIWLGVSSALCAVNALRRAPQHGIGEMSTSNDRDIFRALFTAFFRALFELLAVLFRAFPDTL